VTRRAVLGLAAIACLGLALAATASASEFFAKTVPVEIKATSVGSSAFGLPGASSPITCASVTGEGKLTKSPVNHFNETVKYSKCSDFGAFAVNISNGYYNVQSNGSTSLENTISMKIPLSGCELTLEPTSNKSLTKLVYTNTKSEIEVKAVVSAITEKSTASACGTSGKSMKYEGTSLLAASTAGVRLEVK
jgi:hypothetical protein